MERLEILTNSINWPELVQHVIRDKVVVELFEGAKPVAMLVPIAPPKSMAALEKAIKAVPNLGDDTENFEADLKNIRQNMNQVDDPWVS